MTAISVQLTVRYRILVHRTLRRVHLTPQTTIVRVHHACKLQRVLRLLVPVTKIPPWSHSLLRHLHHDVVAEVEIQTRQHDRLVEIARHRVVIRSERIVVRQQLIVRNILRFPITHRRAAVSEIEPLRKHRHVCRHRRRLHLERTILIPVDEQRVVRQSVEMVVLLVHNKVTVVLLGIQRRRKRLLRRQSHHHVRTDSILVLSVR